MFQSNKHRIDLTKEYPYALHLIRNPTNLQESKNLEKVVYEYNIRNAMMSPQCSQR